MPMSSPTSPTRVVMNAFFAASAADCLLVVVADEAGTSRGRRSSQAKYSSSRLSASTSVSIDATKSEMMA